MSDSSGLGITKNSILVLIVAPILSAGLSILVTNAQSASHVGESQGLTDNQIKLLRADSDLKIDQAKIQSDIKLKELKASSEYQIAQAKSQAETQDKHLQEQIQNLIDKSNEFKKLSELYCPFDSPNDLEIIYTTPDPDPKSSGDVAQIKCSGQVPDLPKEVHLWLSVEVDGFIYFKEGEIEVDRTKNTWSKVFNEPVERGQKKELNLRIYAAGREGHYQIGRWLSIGGLSKSYEKVANISNTFSVGRVVGLRLQPKP